MEEGVFISNSITTFLENLVVHMERSNSGVAKESEKILLEQSLYDIEEKVKEFFHNLRQDYEKMGMCNKVKKFSVYSLILNSRGNLGLELQENAMLYTIRNKMEELQKRLEETFATMENDGARLLEKLKEESKDTRNPVTDEKEIVEKSSVKIVFIDYTENKYENQEKIFPPFAGNEFDIQQKEVFPEVEFQGDENLEKERDKLLEGMRLLRKELESVRAEMQEGFKKGRRLFRKHRMDFNEEEVSSGVKNLECALEAWRRQLKEFRRKVRYFPCSMDGFVSMESRGIDRCFETEDAVARQEWYLTYVDELETRMKTAEEQVTDFRIDV